MNLLLASEVFVPALQLVAAMLLCGAGNLACGRLSSRRRPKGGCSQDWLPHQTLCKAQPCTPLNSAEP